MLNAYETLYGKKIHGTGEVTWRYKPATREESIAAIDWMFDSDENEARATSERIAALEQKALQLVQKQGIGQPRRWIQLAQAVGMDESHPALHNLLDGLDMIPGKMTWKEWQAAMNALLGVLEEAWKKKNSH